MRRAYTALFVSLVAGCSQPALPPPLARVSDFTLSEVVDLTGPECAWIRVDRDSQTELARIPASCLLAYEAWSPDGRFGAFTAPGADVIEVSLADGATRRFPPPEGASGDIIGLGYDATGLVAVWPRGRTQPSPLLTWVRHRLGQPPEDLSGFSIWLFKRSGDRWRFMLEEELPNGVEAKRFPKLGPRDLDASFRDPSPTKPVTDPSLLEALGSNAAGQTWVEVDSGPDRGPFLTIRGDVDDRHPAGPIVVAGTDGALHRVERERPGIVPRLIANARGRALLVRYYGTHGGVLYDRETGRILWSSDSDTASLGFWPQLP